MNSNTLQQLKHDTTRQVVETTRGELLPIKEHRGWKYVNYEGQKIGLNKIPTMPNGQDPDDFAKQYFPAPSHELQTETA